MPNPVAVADLVARWRPLSTAETALGQLLLDDAWALLLYKIPDLEARLAVVGGDPVLDTLVTQVEVAMVRRVMSNPDGIRQESVGQWSYTRDSSLASGALYASTEELALLSPGASGDSFTIRPYGVPGYATPILDTWF